MDSMNKHRPARPKNASERSVPEGIGILMYHRITPRIDGLPDLTWNVTPQRFREQLSGLLASGFRPIPLSETVGYLAEGRSFPPCSFVVTFDDGYENFFTHARPILQELSVPATVFVATAYLDTNVPFPFDDWVASGAPCVPVETWKPLSSQQCVELSGDGLIEVGTHTHTHLDFRRRADLFSQDLQTSLETLRRLMGQQRMALAFPFGHVDPELVAVARAAGLSCSLTIQRSLVRPNDDPFQLGRFEVEQRDSPDSLARSLCEREMMQHRIQRAIRRRYSRWTRILLRGMPPGSRAAR